MTITIENLLRFLSLFFFVVHIKIFALISRWSSPFGSLCFVQGFYYVLIHGEGGLCTSRVGS